MGHLLQHLIQVCPRLALGARRQIVAAVIVGLVLPGRAALACPERSEAARLEAQELLAEQDFAGARRAFEEVTVACPDDAAAWRDIGRTAGASGDPGAAAEAFARANELAHGAADPELHFLRGEALYALGRAAEARAEHDQVLREIGPAPVERLARLWRARIAVRRGQFAEADARFAEIEDAGGAAGDEEATSSRADTLIERHAYARAEQVLEARLARVPTSVRAKELLAWVYELRGNRDAELAMRRAVVAARPDDAIAHRELARVLERMGRLDRALVSYRRAVELHADPELVAAVERLSHRLAPEIVVTLSGFTEPTATSLRLQAGGSAEVSDHLRLGMLGWAEVAQRDIIAGERSRTTGVVGFADVPAAPWLDLRLGVSYRHGVLPRRAIVGVAYLGQDVLGTEGAAVARYGGGVLDIQASYHGLWTEAATAVFEGGDQTGVTAHLGYPLLHGRLILDGAALARTLTLSRDVDGDLPRATHHAWTAGADVVVWSRFANRVRGEFLDDRLARPSDLQDAVVIGYRHYDAYVDANPPFLVRVALAPRARFEAVSGVARKVLWGSRLGVEARGTAGYDYARDTQVLVGGLGVLVSSFAGGRLSVMADLATETSGVVLGRRSWVSVSYHQDLL